MDERTALLDIAEYVNADVPELEFATTLDLVRAIKNAFDEIEGRVPRTPVRDWNTAKVGAYFELEGCPNGPTIRVYRNKADHESTADVVLEVHEGQPRLLVWTDPGNDPDYDIRL